MLDHAPRFDPPAAARIARDVFALDAVARPLPSERDQNFLLETAAGERAVLKVANALEDPAMLDAQQRALAHLAGTGVPTPRVLPTRDGATVAEVGAPDGDGRRHLVWAVTHLPGVPLAAVRRRSPALL